MPTRRAVREVMTSPVVTAEPMTTLAELAELMLERRVGSVVVVDPENPSRVVGIVTETDFEISDEPIPFTFFRWPHALERWVWSEESLEQLYAERQRRPAASIMSSPVTTIDAGAEVWEAVATMLKNGIKHLPVLEDGALVGIVSRHDLLKLLALEASRQVPAAPLPERLLPSIFDRVVCGVDGSPESIEGLRQAARLVTEGGRLVAATVRTIAQASRAGFLAPRAAAQLEQEADAAQDAARGLLGEHPGAELRLIEGRPVPALLALADAERATLLAVGSHGGGRAMGLLVGSVASMLVHEAPCPVLVARVPPWEDGFPRALLVGYDGSAPSRRALAAAQELGERVGAAVRVLSASGGKPLREPELGGVPGLERDTRAPADALVEESRHADLVLVGSRGLHGLRSLGSVSEKVAHGAHCSVLVVRPLAYGE
jgi:nucleotide-binding universal stress UspA family protein